jgi:hypothetical protein
MPVETMKLRLRALLAIVSASAPTMAAENYGGDVVLVDRLRGGGPVNLL